MRLESRVRLSRLRRSSKRPRRTTGTRWFWCGSSPSPSGSGGTGSSTTPLMPTLAASASCGGGRSVSPTCAWPAGTAGTAARPFTPRSGALPDHHGLDPITIYGAMQAVSGFRGRLLQPETFHFQEPVGREKVRISRSHRLDERVLPLGRWIGGDGSHSCDGFERLTFLSSFSLGTRDQRTNRGQRAMFEASAPVLERQFRYHFWRPSLGLGVGLGWHLDNQTAPVMNLLCLNDNDCCLNHGR